MAELDTVALLTEAADALERVVELPSWASDWEHVKRTLTSDGWCPEVLRLLTAFGPDFARALAATLRAQLALHAAWHVCPSGVGVGCTDFEADSDTLQTCPTLLALRPLAELIVQQLGGES